MCIISRTTRGIAPGTPISPAHNSGTSWKPSLRAASAGNSAVRSLVAVKITLMTSSVLRSLRVITSVTSSAVPARISARSSAPTWIAPRTARTATCLPSRPGPRPAPFLLTAPKPLQPDGRVQVADFLDRQLPGRARPQRPERDRADVRAHQPRHRVPGRGQHPLDDVLAALVQGDLHERTGAEPLYYAEFISAGHAVV